MHPSVVVVTAYISFLSTSYSLWASDIMSPRGLSLGDETFVRIESTNASNSSFLERLALRIDTGGMGISLRQNQETKAVELNFHGKDTVEGRGKKMDDKMVPFMVGAAGAGLITMMLSGVKMIIVKALILAKIALVFSIIFLIGKLMQREEHHPSHMEVEQYAASEALPVYTEYSNSGAGGDLSASYGGYPYSGYGPSAAAAETALSYATVEPGSNGTLALAGVQQVAPSARRRKHTSSRKSKPLVLTIKHYGGSDNDLI